MGEWYAAERDVEHAQDERGVDLYVRLYSGQTVRLFLVSEGRGEDHPKDLALLLSPNAADE